jgi:hypothetical protein
MGQAITRVGFSPREFAAAFGRHPSWTYRLAYKGQLKVIGHLGRLLIPASELDRILSSAEIYNPDVAKSNKELATTRQK